MSPSPSPAQPAGPPSVGAGDDTLARRRAFRAELDQVHAEADRRAVALAKERELLQKAIGYKEAALTETRTAMASLTQEAAVLSNARGVRVGRLEGELRETCSPQIPAAAERIEALLAELRHSAVGVQREGTRGLGFRTVASEAASTDRRFAALVAARQQLKDLELEAIDEAEVARRLEALFDGLPVVTYEPVPAA